MWSHCTSSSSLCFTSRSLSSFCCRLRAFISSIECFFSRSFNWGAKEGGLVWLWWHDNADICIQEAATLTVSARLSALSFWSLRACWRARSSALCSLTACSTAWRDSELRCSARSLKHQPTCFTFVIWSLKTHAFGHLQVFLPFCWTQDEVWWWRKAQRLVHCKVLVAVFYAANNNWQNNVCFQQYLSADLTKHTWTCCSQCVWAIKTIIN